MKGFEISRGHSGDEQSSLLGLVNTYRRFGGAWCLYFQNLTVQYCLTVAMVPLLDSEDGSITSHRNFGTHLPVDKRSIPHHFSLHRKGSMCNFRF